MDSMAIETTFGRRSSVSNTEASKCAQHSGIHMMTKCEFLLVKWSFFAESYRACHKLYILYKVVWNKVRSKKLWPKLKRQFPENSFKGWSTLKHYRVIVRIAHGPLDPTTALCGLEPCFLHVSWSNHGNPRNSPNWPDASNWREWSKNFTPTIFLALIWHLIRSHCVIRQQHEAKHKEP
jgi:hypothetical protein